MSNKKQTAVDWLLKEFELYFLGESKLVYYEITDQAKEMFEQQIMDAYHINPLESKWENIGEQYYKETYE